MKITKRQLRKIIKEEIKAMGEETKDAALNKQTNTHKNCGGEFKEMSLYDDWHGTRTCSKCGKSVPAKDVPLYTTQA
ncbi:MAG: hypothetical protein ACYSWP_03715 [Planctomycetota bacterium]|jgi:hypothetical protein